MPGAGHPGVWPEIRDLMSRTARELRSRSQIFGPTGRMSGGPDVRGYGLNPNPRMNSRNSVLGVELMILGAKFERFHGWKVGKLGKMLDPLETKQIHGSNSTKHRQTNKSQKNWGLFLVGIFEFWMKSTKSS